MGRHVASCSLLLLAAFGSFSCMCSDTVECGPGTHAEGGLCVPDESDAGATDAHPHDAAGGSEGDDGEGPVEDAGDNGAIEDARDRGVVVDAGDGGTVEELLIRCRDEWDCPIDRICVDAACVPPPVPCESDLDCPRDLVCDHGSCVAECGSGTATCECGATEICVGHRCVAPPSTCAKDEDCPCIGEANRCAGGTCIAECTPPCGCAPGWSCVGNRCVVSPGGCIFDDECSCRGGGYASDTAHCFDGACGRPCTGPCDCAAGFSGDVACVEGSCVERTEPCRTDADCPCAGTSSAQCVLGLCMVPCGWNCDCDSPAAGSRTLCVDGYCQVPLGPCDDDAGCPCDQGVQTTCDEGTCRYPACVSPCDCAPGFGCVGDVCTPSTPWSCTVDDDCPCGQPCVDDDVGGFPCCGCWENAHCPPGLVCDPTTRICGTPPSACRSNVDCPLDDGNGPPRCVAGRCVHCGSTYSCFGSDTGCTTTCEDGTHLLCHHSLNNPDDDINSYCAPPCSSNADCVVYFPYPGGVCRNGRCTISYDDIPNSCATDADCPALQSPAGGGRFTPICRHGDCVPASCVDSCDCPLWPRPQICVAGACERAPDICATVDDCPCLNGGQVGCNDPGVCGPAPW